MGVEEPLSSLSRDGGASVDSTIEEDGAVDSESVDSAAVDDSSAGDSATAPDTATTDTGLVADTLVADSSAPDSAVVDTAKPDTTVADTAMPDTAVVDTGTTCAVRGCAMGTETRSGCANARTIGRTTAATATGYKISDDLCSATNKFDESGSSCWDANADHAYKIWLQSGDVIDMSLTASWPCLSSAFSWYATLKIIENAGCDDTACTTRTFCAYNKTSHNKSFTAPRDGWYILTVEGSSAFDDEGDYTFSVKLTCKTPGCGCP